MIVGIVGSEQAKFDERTEAIARQLIRDLIKDVEYVVSGASPLGGVDTYAMEEAKALNKPFTAFPPNFHRWDTGYKPRNMRIARASDKVVCITLRTLPPSYKGMRFALCYHCKTADHIKSGGCWTVKFAKSLGKQGEVIVIT